ncbi:MAG: hypothetical protein RBT47_09610 [Anaerolineae bacterium]|jgi:hypothetical protein|nr:hypothetical protein [Anaerolineae bacterium]
MKKWMIGFDLLCLGLVLLLIGGGTPPQPRVSESADGLPLRSLVVLAEPEDPYAVLADEIAQAEDAPRLNALEELEAVDAAYVVYVASPAWLTESKLLALSTLSVTTGRYPAVGIISGSTLEQARALWLRGAEVHAGKGFLGSGIDEPGKLAESTLWEMSAEPVAAQPLTKPGLLDALATADYFYWARHASPAHWYWYEGEEPVIDEELSGTDLPVLGPVVIHTPSCRSFLPWREDSIALAFTDHGAAAYLGHLYSPCCLGYFIGSLHTLPGYNTWPGVPMGVLAQIQNRASERPFATQPYFFMLGDPRIALQASAPYTITSDTLEGNCRVIRGTWESAAPEPGVLPLRIEGGAAYPFIRVTGVGAVADSDLFYNRAIQPLAVQGDKVVLILHANGPFEVVLRGSVPFLWRQVDTLRDAFEYTWCTVAPVADWLGVVPLLLLPGLAVVKRLRKKPLRPYLPALGIGVGWAGIQLAFCLLRAGKVSVSPYLLRPTAGELGWAFVETAAFVLLGLVWMMDARKLWGKVLGLGVCVAPTVVLLGFYTGFIALLNLFMSQKVPMGIWPLNYTQVRLLAIVAIVEAVVALNAYWLLCKSLTPPTPLSTP